MSATDEYPTTPPPTITTTTFIPYPTSQQQQPQPGSFLTGSGLSTPLLAGSISVGAFGLAIVAICIWFKYMGRNSPDTVVRRFVDRMLPARVRRRRLEQLEEEEEVAAAARQRRRGSTRQSRRGRGSERGRRSRARPGMFDAWIETVDDALKKWEGGESVPLAARVFTRGSSAAAAAAAAAAACTNEAEVSSRVGGRDSICEEKDEGKQMRQGVATGSSTTLQVAVLLQMPSPPARHSVTVTDAQNDISVRDELVIGLVEAPWTRDSEQPSSREGEETTTNLSHT